MKKEYFEGGDYPDIRQAIDLTHPFVFYTPNLIRAGKYYDGSTWILVMELGTRLKFNSGSFQFKNDGHSQRKLGLTTEQIDGALKVLLADGIISVINQDNSIYQMNPSYFWKGTMITMLMKDDDLRKHLTYTLNEEYETVEDLTHNRVVSAILDKQKQLHPDSVPNNFDEIDTLPNEVWVSAPGLGESYHISNQGRVRIALSKGFRYRRLDRGVLQVKQNYYSIAKLVKEYFPG